MQRSLWLVCLLWAAFTNTAHAQCADLNTVHGSRDDVLVIVNLNHTDSCDVGIHYANQRNVRAANIAQIYSPPNFFVSWENFVILRDQLIRHLQGLIQLDDPAFTPISCTGTASPYYCQAAMDQLRQHTKIKYLITTKGVPTRMRPLLTSGTYGEATSVDNYLRHWLLEYYPSDTTFEQEVRHRLGAFGDGRGMRNVEPVLDHEFIIGRIDGLTTANAQALVDRAINAEADGVFGNIQSFAKVNGSGAKPIEWRDYTYWDLNPNSLRFGVLPSAKVYKGGATSDAWRYLFGVFAENDPACSDYTSNYLSFTASTGKAPAQCVVSINGFGSNDQPPGRPGSRIPAPTDSMLYLGELDGQPTTGVYADFLNWRKSGTACAAYPGATLPLCDNLPADQQAACRSQSVDALTDIDTRCAGVADGFIGYNHQSFPVSYFWVWPKYWGFKNASVFDVYFAELRNGNAHTGNHSLWVSSSMADSANCFNTSTEIGATSTPIGSCGDLRQRVVDRIIDLPVNQIVSDVNPVTFDVDFWSNGQSNTVDVPVNVALYRRDPAGKELLIANQQVMASTLPGWAAHNLSFTATASATATIDKVHLIITIGGTPFNDIGFDDFSIRLDGDTNNIVSNASFEEGYGVSTGDHAANFLSRLNGTAFWGSSSHHGSGGHSFSDNTMESIIFFMRGLPLGEAVWLGEQRPSGIFYGDPLYSPVAVNIDYVNANDFADRFDGNLLLSGSTINGHDVTRTTTAYTIDYCTDPDFYHCDNSNAWIPITSGTGKKWHETLAPTIDGNTLPRGDLLLRLSVTTTNTALGKSQTLQDFYHTRNWTGCSLLTASQWPLDEQDWDDSDNDNILNPCDNDDDGDGVDDIVDEFPRDPTEWLDTDNDGIGNNADLDDDNDGLSDIEEAILGTSPLDADSDNDFINDGDEVAQGTNPLVANKEFYLPVFRRILLW